MPLSSNTLIHFTRDKDSLKGILTENFKLKYCKETIQFSGAKQTLHIPMVSFCDIPLSQIKNHIASYGHYGIGLSRQWAIQNRLNPVLYIQDRSALAQSYEDLIKHFGRARKNKEKVSEDARRLAVDIVRYIKNYEGPLTRSGKRNENYRFSDEREWRYVPGHDSDCSMLFTAEEFRSLSKEKANAELSKFRLCFEPDDIKYIIIKNDQEIKEFVEHLRDSKGDKYSLRQIDRLTTRILTSDQIHHDI